MSILLVSKIKIIEVFDLTAAPIRYKQRNSYTEFNTVEHLIYFILIP